MTDEVARMKAKPYRWDGGKSYVPCEPADATHIELRLPGPLPHRMLPVRIGGTRNGTPNWTWNGSVDSPTVRPSVMTRGSDDLGNEVLCHSFVKDGRVQFLSDCTHEFAGQTLDLLDVE